MLKKRGGLTPFHPPHPWHLLDWVTHHQHKCIMNNTFPLCPEGWTLLTAFIFLVIFTTDWQADHTTRWQWILFVLSRSTHRERMWSRSGSRRLHWYWTSRCFNTVWWEEKLWAKYEESTVISLFQGEFFFFFFPNIRWGHYMLIQPFVEISYFRLTQVIL